RRPCLPPEPLGEAFVRAERVVQHLDGNAAVEGLVLGGPHRPHPAGRDPFAQPVSAAEQNSRRRGRHGHVLSARQAWMMVLATGPAPVPPVADAPAPPPSRSTTATAIRGFPPGANATNHTSGFPEGVCAVPVFAATWTPGI